MKNTSSIENALCHVLKFHLYSVLFIGLTILPLFSGLANTNLPLGTIDEDSADILNFGIIHSETTSTTSKILYQTTITGTVTDAAGIPLPGASVVVMGTTRGTTTDFDGNYSIEAASDAVLSISYIGYRTTEVQVNNQTTVNVSLEEDAALLDEVVLVGYGTQKKG